MATASLKGSLTAGGRLQHYDRRAQPRSAEAGLGPSSLLQHRLCSSSAKWRTLRRHDLFGSFPLISSHRKVSSSTQCYAGSETDQLLETSDNLADLQAQLDNAVASEDYARAAQIRDNLERLKQDNRLAVEDAHRRFYDAFKMCDQKAMDAIWGEGEHVQCIHPGGNCIAGRKSNISLLSEHELLSLPGQVLESWRIILSSGPMNITLEDVRIYAGDTQALVTCVEAIDAGESRGRIAATNILEKQGGRWVIIHHHGSPAPIFV